MALVSHVLAMALGAGGAGGNEAEPATVRCRPAPYMVSDVGAAKPAKITLTYGQAQATAYA
ncbi:MAG: hypothetical protein U1C74_29540, partial [Phenylobacterium sp.]|nr:hypothetical protein [Phenylobacterium sp.]